LPDLAVGTPAEVAVPGVVQIHVRDLLKTAGRVEARRELICERFSVDKSICVCRVDGLFVKMRSVALASGEVVESDAVVIAMGAYPGEVVKRKKKLSKK